MRPWLPDLPITTMEKKFDGLDIDEGADSHANIN